ECLVIGVDGIDAADGRLNEHAACSGEIQEGLRADAITLVGEGERLGRLLCDGLLELDRLLCCLEIQIGGRDVAGELQVARFEVVVRVVPCDSSLLELRFSLVVIEDRKSNKRRERDRRLAERKRVVAVSNILNLGLGDRPQSAAAARGQSCTGQNRVLKQASLKLRLSVEAGCRD